MTPILAHMVFQWQKNLLKSDRQFSTCLKIIMAWDRRQSKGKSKRVFKEKVNYKEKYVLFLNLS